jgi:type I restriction enzyme R subunit
VIVSPESEAETRKRRIDPRLVVAGWTVKPYKSDFAYNQAALLAVEEWPTAAGPADYALHLGGDAPAGVVEAKKVTVGPNGVLTQAERYSRGIHSPAPIRGEYGALPLFHERRS